MAAPAVAVVAKKAAAILLTDKRTWTVIGSVIAGVIAFVILAVTVIFGGLSAHSTAKEEGGAAMRTALSALFADGELPADMPAEYRDGLNGLREMVTEIESEIKNQGLETDPLKAQIIVLCALSDRAGNETFYPDYISCFADAADDDHIFDNIDTKFDVALTADDRAKILELYQSALEYTAVSGTPSEPISP